MRYKKSEMVFIDDKPICPDCINHEQGEPMEVHDCKNIYYYHSDGDNNNKFSYTEGQCCCYSKEHGIREEY